MARLIFRVRTPLGNWVQLSRDRWRQIVRYKHRSLAGKEKLVRACLESPALVRTSAKDADVHLYYSRSGRGYLCVVTAPSNGVGRFVVTAYFTNNMKQGVELWKK